MPVYTVHGRVDMSDDRAADRFTFVRDGFHFWAFLLAPFWLLWHRLWLAFFGWLVLTVGVSAGIAALGAGPDAVLSANFLIALLMGLEANTLWRWKLSRGKWRQAGIVVAETPEAAEQRFFDSWKGYDTPSTPAGSPPPIRASQPAARGGIIGLFPEPGGSR